jgi:hypothetical protein
MSVRSRLAGIVLTLCAVLSVAVLAPATASAATVKHLSLSFDSSPNFGCTGGYWYNVSSDRVCTEQGRFFAPFVTFSPGGQVTSYRDTISFTRSDGLVVEGVISDRNYTTGAGTLTLTRFSAPGFGTQSAPGQRITAIILPRSKILVFGDISVGDGVGGLPNIFGS